MTEYIDMTLTVTQTIRMPINQDFFPGTYEMTADEIAQYECDRPLVEKVELFEIGIIDDNAIVRTTVAIVDEHGSTHTLTEKIECVSDSRNE
jgi:hypothetical protein